MKSNFWRSVAATDPNVYADLEHLCSLAKIPCDPLALSENFGIEFIGDRATVQADGIKWFIDRYTTVYDAIPLWVTAKVARLSQNDSYMIHSKIEIENLDCPHCGTRHVDENEWAHRPHKTHLCFACNTCFEGTKKAVSYPRYYILGANDRTVDLINSKEFALLQSFRSMTPVEQKYLLKQLEHKQQPISLASFE